MSYYNSKTIKSILAVLIFFCFTPAQSYAQYASREDTQKEIKQLRNYLETAPKDKKLLTALGQTYFSLASNFQEGRQPERAQICLDSARYFYVEALKVDAQFFEALYGYGVLYYNLAMGYYGERQALPISARESYQELTKTTNDLLGLAHKYFVKAESVNPNDSYVAAAFKELYTLTNHLEGYVEYKNRLKSLEADPSASFAPYDGHPPSSEVKL